MPVTVTHDIYGRRLCIECREPGTYARGLCPKCYHRDRQRRHRMLCICANLASRFSHHDETFSITHGLAGCANNRLLGLRKRVRKCAVRWAVATGRRRCAMAAFPRTFLKPRRRIRGHADDRVVRQGGC
jgi:hypothetical protein